MQRGAWSPWQKQHSQLEQLVPIECGLHTSCAYDVCALVERLWSCAWAACSVSCAGALAWLAGGFSTGKCKVMRIHGRLTMGRDIVLLKCTAQVVLPVPSWCTGCTGLLRRHAFVVRAILQSTATAGAAYHGHLTSPLATHTRVVNVAGGCLASPPICISTSAGGDAHDQQGWQWWPVLW
jgi:hypothetical protein